jgi:hypothetical protein
MLGAYALSVREGDSFYFWTCWTIPLLTAFLSAPNSLSNKLLVQIPLIITNLLLGLITFAFLFAQSNIGAGALIYVVPMIGFFPISIIYYIVVAIFLSCRKDLMNPSYLLIH